MKESQIIDGKYVDLRNDILKRVQNEIKSFDNRYQSRRNMSLPNFLEWSWGTQTSRTRNIGEVEYCELIFKQKSVSSEIKDYIFHLIVHESIDFGKDILFECSFGQCVWRYKYESELN